MIRSGHQEMTTTKRWALKRFVPIIAGVASVIAAASGTLNAETDKHDSPWQLIRSADPRGGADAVAVMHTADASKSDVGLAGMMLRCSAQDLEVVVVATMPFEPRARPHVSLRAGETQTAFDTTVVPPLSALLLPREATMLVDRAWRSSTELLIDIEDGSMVIKGVVSLVGLQSAVATLRANCPLR
jgi:hypothetical protein